MAVTTTVEKKQYFLNLNNGSSTTGAVRTIKQSLGTFVAKNADDAKALTIAGLVEQCLARSVYSFTSVVTSEISA